MIINKKNFDSVVKDGVVLLDFWASWCGPCNAISPMLDRLEKSYNGSVKIGKINIDEESGLTVQHDISAVPAFALYKDGQMVKRMYGIQTEAVLRRELDNLLESKNA